MSTKYYKVVTDKLFSAKTCWHGKRIQYQINEWTKAPNNTRLFVFDDFNEAKRFYIDCVYDWRSCEKYLIYECKIRGNIKHKGASEEDRFDEFWKMFNSFLKMKKKPEINMFLSTWNAVLCKKVMLTNIIDLS